jgi:hypothetical protein
LWSRGDLGFHDHNQLELSEIRDALLADEVHHIQLELSSEIGDQRSAETPLPSASSHPQCQSRLSQRAMALRTCQQRMPPALPAKGKRGEFEGSNHCVQLASEEEAERQSFLKVNRGKVDNESSIISLLNFTLSTRAPDAIAPC